MDSNIEHELEKHQFVVINTVGVSMRPLLQEKKTHVVLKQASGTLRKNDIALYRRQDGQLILHRIIAVKDDFYYFRGDNCITQEHVSKEHVIAVVTKIYKNGAYISMDDVAYLRYVGMWNGIYPVRHVGYWIRGKLYGLKSRWRRYETKRRKNN